MHKTILTGLCGIFVVFAGLLSVSADERVPDEQLFIIHYTTGTAWLPDAPFSDQPHAREHSENLRRLREAGRLILGARYDDKGIILLRAPSEAEARAQIERDPAIGAGVFTYELSPFLPFYDGCVERQRLSE